MRGKRVLALLLLPFLLFYSLPVQAVEKEDRTWQDEMIYFIMVDRFNNGNFKNDFQVNMNDPKAYHGGDIEGVTNKLDYIKDMGFTAIWLTPIFKNEEKGYHGYWTEDFYEVEEHFGTKEDVKKLVEEAHKRDIKVILDFVVNHVGYNHPWSKDAEKADWFHEQKEIANWDSQEEVENGWIYGLPDLNQENPDVENYLIDVAKWWIQETDIDGYRLDTVKHVPKEFWNEFSKEVKSVKKDFFLLGEVWHNDPRYISQYKEAGIDAFVDFPLYEQVSTTFSKVDQSQQNPYDVWKRNQAYYENPYLLGTFIDSHDTVRFTRKALQNKQHPGTRTKQALSYLYTSPGIPIVYYGTEIALDGGEDPDNRRLMDFRTDKEVIDYVKNLAQLRAELPSLTRGTFDVLYEKGGMALYQRTYKDETTLVAINNTSSTQVVDLEGDMFGEDKQLKGLLEEDIIRPVDGQYKVALDREKTNVYVVTDKKGLNTPYIVALVVVYVAFGLFLFLARKRRKKSS
ncbi:alpha-amylase family glycosyl hydrolase [Metabacillus iocasae]|uniref:Alpha-amylase n=1 Tax=Priestia iocasae TaxID=2291674 RepID=A0ABS2QV57_9BACI|nr:alpha-amylase [Metabacillus iocasae]